MHNYPLVSSNAKIIVDKYHFISQFSWAIENIHKQLQRSMPAFHRKYYKRSRKLILTHYKKLKDKNIQAWDLMLQYNDDLRLAHVMKELFYDVCQIASYRGQQQNFYDWISNAIRFEKKIEKCSKMIQFWRKVKI